ncbi:MAG: radical SAM protein [Clostridia bacterium]|nr:radical SAM protein [Clostridia bacterium]
MKNIYFVQVGFSFDGSVYLPYAAGTLIANALRYPEIKEEYAFPDIIYCRERLAEALDKLRDPYMVAFSASVWNMEYNKTLAALVKEKYPDCLILFGGHSVRPNGELLEFEPYIDYLLPGEGEEIFVKLLFALKDDAASIARIPAIAFRKDGAVICNPVAEPGDPADYPSPYLTGVFDKIMAENNGREFLAVLETNRGCPYRCAYCDWVNGKRMRFFPMEKISAEIDWLGRHGIGYVFCGDSNFGMFERDYEITLSLIEAKKKYGYPEAFRVCYEKNSADRVFRICKALNEYGMDKGATMSYQTLSPEALKNIGRKNLTIEHFSDLVRKYTEAGIPAYSELILGLPGETLESFCSGLCRLLESGQHNSLSVYNCEMLPNAYMADPEYIQKYGIKVIKVEFNHIHSAPEKKDEVQEYSYIIRATDSMPADDWTAANLFSVCLQAFHSLGVLKYFAIYFFRENICSYYDFYFGLLEFLLKADGKLGELFRTFREKYDNSLSGDWTYHNVHFGNITWFFEEGVFLEIVDGYDEGFTQLLPYLKGFEIPQDLLVQLSDFSRQMLRKPLDKVVTVGYDYDFYDYFEKILIGEYEPLRRVRNRLTVTPDSYYSNVEEYGKSVVWFGRRKGRTVYHSKEIQQDFS